MSKKQKLFWAVALALALVLGLVILVDVNLPMLANHFGFALPGEGGLPFRVTYRDREYNSPDTCAYADWCRGPGTVPSALCWSKEHAQRFYYGPLVQVGSVPTLFGASHPLLAPRGMVDSTYTVMTVYVQVNANCYVPYTIGGGP